MQTAGKPMRIFFFNVAVAILIGIWLTGFGMVHWFSYVIPAFMLFAAASGICPGIIMMQKVFGNS